MNSIEQTESTQIDLGSWWNTDTLRAPKASVAHAARMILERMKNPLTLQEERAASNCHPILAGG
jgi:hypothetical protein